ncbi:MAG: histidinol dehydrogenase [Thermoplasmatota archaeon]
MPEDARRDVFQRGQEDLRAATEAVRPIADAVRTAGDEALRTFTKKFDHVDVAATRIPDSDLRAALDRIPAPLAQALEQARRNLERFHRAQRSDGIEVDVGRGIHAGRRVIPLARVGCYVPGGRAAYPSTVLHNTVPAKVAGVREIVVATPPPVSDVVLAACAVAGATEVHAVGGAQAIFALAYGTKSIRRVDKIVGPGNVYVAAAKALVAPLVATDAPAGPSEIFIVADETAPAAWVAWEILAQAEHDPLAAAVLASPSRPLIDRVRAAISAKVDETPRGGIIREALARRGAILACETLEEALAAAESYAPEHLALMVKNPRRALTKVTSYGSAFLGSTSPVAAGDYASGPNHVLPTSSLARGRAGLSVDDFVRKPTHQELTPQGLATLAPTIRTLAEAEGLHAHATSIAVRAEIDAPRSGGAAETRPSPRGRTPRRANPVSNRTRGSKEGRGSGGIRKHAGD